MFIVQSNDFFSGLIFISGFFVSLMEDLYDELFIQSRRNSSYLIPLIIRGQCVVQNPLAYPIVSLFLTQLQLLVLIHSTYF